VSFLWGGLAPSLGRSGGFRLCKRGAGGLQPSEQSIPERYIFLWRAGNCVFAVYWLAVVVAPTIGPWLGAGSPTIFLRWIFYINVPVVNAVAAADELLFRDPRTEKSKT